MAHIKIHEIDDLLSVDDFFHHGGQMTVLSILGMPVLYGPPGILDHQDREDALEELKPHIAKALAKLLLADGNLPEWQAEPVDVEPPY
jgi:hypothetical protein